MKTIAELLRSYADFIMKQLLLKCIMLPNLMLFKVLTHTIQHFLACHLLARKNFRKNPRHPFHILTAFFPSSVLDRVRLPAR